MAKSGNAPLGILRCWVPAWNESILRPFALVTEPCNLRGRRTAESEGRDRLLFAIPRPPHDEQPPHRPASRTFQGVSLPSLQKRLTNKLASHSLLHRTSITVTTERLLRSRMSTARPLPAKNKHLRPDPLHANVGGLPQNSGSPQLTDVDFPWTLYPRSLGLPGVDCVVRPGHLSTHTHTHTRLVSCVHGCIPVSPFAVVSWELNRRGLDENKRRAIRHAALMIGPNNNSAARRGGGRELEELEGGGASISLYHLDASIASASIARSGEQPLLRSLRHAAHVPLRYSWTLTGTHTFPPRVCNQWWYWRLLCFAIVRNDGVVH